MPTQARTIADIRLEIEDILGDNASAWSDARYRRAINRAIRELSNKVLVPTIYDLSSAWSQTEYAYAIPAWLDTSTIEPEWRNQTAPYTWKAVPGYTIERQADGQTYIRFQTAPFQASGRLRYWHPNTPAPLTDPLLNATITAVQTTLVTKTKLTDAEPNGFIKIGDEFIQYSGITQAASNTTLNNLIRGIAGTVAAPHTADDQMYWALMVDEPIIYTAITYLTLTYMHEMYLNESAARNQRHHQEMIAYYRAAADTILRQYVPSVSPRFTLDARGEQID
jgi:hypothetical protein